MSRPRSEQLVVAASADPTLSRSRLRAGTWHCLAIGLAVLQCSCQALAPSAPVRGPLPRAASDPPGPAAAFRFASPAAAERPGPPAVDGQFAVQPAAYSPPALPPDAWTGAPAEQGRACGGECCGSLAAGPIAYTATWRPPGIGGIWPAEEYLFDGGDHPPPAAVLRDWTVLGLDEEDTIAHYDTLDGRTEVEPANRVPIYAPRFAAVRKVSGLAINQQRSGVAGVDAPTRIILHDRQDFATTMHQPVQSGRFVGLDAPQRFRESLHLGDTTGGLRLDRLAARFKSYEDFEAIRTGRYDNSEKARLAEWLEAAHVWTSDQAVQVVIDRVVANLAVGSSSSQAIYHYELPEGKPRLRVLKVASRQQAQPGDEIDFTLRFDNVGDQVIGNVTLLDNLTARLEYLPDSAECSPAANFFTEENPAGSLILRWEIIDPLPVGKGGVARFRCRVR